MYKMCLEKLSYQKLKNKKPLKDYRLCEENSRANVKELPLAKYREVKISVRINIAMDCKCCKTK